MPSHEQEQAKSGAARPVPSWLSTAALLGMLTALVLMWSLRAAPPSSAPPGTVPPGSAPPQTSPLQTERLSLTPQECVTECQAQQTDCIQECDGRISCEKECVGAGEACVAHCRRPGDAGVRSSTVTAPPTPP